MAPPVAKAACEIRRSFYMKLIENLRGRQALKNPDWLRMLKTERGARVLLKSRFLQQVQSSVQEDDLERSRKFGTEKVCLGSCFTEHNRIKRNLYDLKTMVLSKTENEKN